MRPNPKRGSSVPDPGFLDPDPDSLIYKQIILKNLDSAASV
jgi:hypothetical protein